MSKDTIPALALLYIIAYLIKLGWYGLSSTLDAIDASNTELAFAFFFIIAVLVFLTYLKDNGPSL